MPLTPLDLQKAEYTRGWRGYSQQQVDAFLNKIGRDYELLYKENLELKDRLLEMQEEVDKQKNLEQTLKQTMVLAQQVADEAKQTAGHEAEIILREAEQKAKDIVADAENRAKEALQRYEELIRETCATKATIRGILIAQLELWEGDSRLGKEQAG